MFVPQNYRITSDVFNPGNDFVDLTFLFVDTFASKVAAVGDKYADSSIGNVTGSNAVNVFLGENATSTLTQNN